MTTFVQKRTRVGHKDVEVPSLAEVEALIGGGGGGGGPLAPLDDGGFVLRDVDSGFYTSGIYVTKDATADPEDYTVPFTQLGPEYLNSYASEPDVRFLGVSAFDDTRFRFAMDHTGRMGWGDGIVNPLGASGFSLGRNEGGGLVLRDPSQNGLYVTDDPSANLDDFAVAFSEYGSGGIASWASGGLTPGAGGIFINVGGLADSWGRFVADHAGSLYWGDGTTSPFGDGGVSLGYRASGADSWATPEGLRLDGTLDVVHNALLRAGDLSMGPLGEVGVYFDGSAGVGVYNYITMLFDPHIEMKDGATPGAPAADAGLFYFNKNGSNKMEFVVRFPTGPAQVLATEA